MCGIAGIFGEASGLDREALLRALRHRGPDRQAALAPAPGVWLAAARLAISDPSSAGDQPMSTEDGALTVVHNGEIYNAPALRRELEGRGHRFRSRSDTEVLLRGYREWGGAMVERLDGMFAFALWDAERRRLLLARDALGIKPLWLARAGGRVVFASEVRALLAARAIDASLEPAAVRSFLAGGSVAEPQAIVRGVEALPPGELLTLGGASQERRRFWSVPTATGERLPTAAAAAEVRSRLTTSVRSCLEADVPVALLLSGGIDSAALAYLAGTEREVRTFHVRVGAQAAERAARVARQLGFRHEEVVIDAEAAHAALPSLLAAQDQPSVDGVNTFFIARAIREAGLKAAVTGLGADELFLGYSLHRTYTWGRLAQRLTNGTAAPLRRVLKVAAQVAAGAPRGNWKIDKVLELAAAPDGTSLYAAARALFPAATRGALIEDATSADDHSTLAIGSPADEVTRLEIAGYLVNTLLRDTDVMSMAHGVELRVPMLDRGLVEAVVPLAQSLKLRRGRAKPLLVDAVPELPRELFEARKEGFELPLERWMAVRFGDEVEALLTDRPAAQRVGLHPEAVGAVWRRFRARGDRPSAFRAWALYALLAWAHAHGASA